jgi:hypothetical protein
VLLRPKTPNPFDASVTDAISLRLIQEQFPNGLGKGILIPLD